MTTSPDTPRLAFTDLADAVVALRERGLRLTTPRRLVLEALFAAEGPVSAEHLAHGLRVDVTSVYRNLETLEQHGLARHVHLGHGPGLYVLVGRGEREFLSCERCGAVRTLTPEQLDPVREQIEAQFGYQARFTHFPIVGLCPACLTQRPPEGRRPPSSATGPNAGGPGRHAPQDGQEHQHSHGDHVHSHPHKHDPGRQHTHEGCNELIEAVGPRRESVRVSVGPAQPSALLSSRMAIRTAATPAASATTLASNRSRMCVGWGSGGVIRRPGRGSGR